MQSFTFTAIRKVLRSLRRQRPWNIHSSPTSRRYSGPSHEIKGSDHTLFNYTSGRWLYNEHLRFPERQLHFNVDGLCLTVAKSVGLSANDIVDFTKIAEGGSYRIFEATFRNGLAVIARLPYPCTVPRWYGVASEVATMEFLRLHGVPIPQVFDWSSTASNQVGSEYIVMERVSGKELEYTWFSMTLQDRMSAVEKIVKIEKILFGIRFPASGSLFFKSSLGAGDKSVDIPNIWNTIDAGKFCIGPSTEYLWWYQKRDELAVKPGPWNKTEEVLKAVGERELAWLRKFGEPRYPREPLYRELYGHRKVDPQCQIDRLKDYLTIVPHLVPKKEGLNIPTIRHPDLSPNNIFISDSGDITGIIDWQHTTVLPMFVQAKIPEHFQNYGDDDSENFVSPQLPPDFDTMAEDDKEREMELYRRRQVHYFYVGFTSRNNQAHFDAIRKYNLITRNQLYDTAGRPWEGDNTSLHAQLIKTLTYWSEFHPGEEASDPPIQYPQTEVAECQARDSEQKEADEQMKQIRDFIGVNIDGWVPTEGFEMARERERYIKTEMLDAADTEEERREIHENWPFQDHDEID